mgnify:CR=1 FL=1
MDRKAVTTMIVAFAVIQFLISCRIFVTFEGMAAYAASKDSIQQIQEQLNRIEHKLDKVMGY